jgi:hypothetical protein
VHYGTHLAILRDKIPLYRMGITCMARYEAWSVIELLAKKIKECSRVDVDLAK